MIPEEILNSHIQICEQTYQVLLEENNALKAEGKEPSKEILAKKKQLMPELDLSVKNIKSIRNEVSIKEAKNQELVQKAQKKLMKIFYLIRENEQLLLKSIAKPAMQTTRPTSINELQNIYGKK